MASALKWECEFKARSASPGIISAPGAPSSRAELSSFDGNRAQFNAKEENKERLRVPFDQFKVPDSEVRARWRPSAIGIWANGLTQHSAVDDCCPAKLLSERVTRSGGA